MHFERVYRRLVINSWIERVKTEYKFNQYAQFCSLTGELWGVYCEYLLENWPRYNGIAL